MISLLDAQVLVALFDPAHLHHELAHEWFEMHGNEGWASCPMTENGFARVVSHPEYPGNRIAVSEALDRLSTFADGSEHHFWPDSTSLRRRSRVDMSLLDGHEQVTGVYLLMLAAQNEGRLVTFQRGLPLDAVGHAGPDQLMVLGA